MQTESRKLRWYAPIWKDPLGWARWVGNSKIHLAYAVLFHLMLWAALLAGLLMFATWRTSDEAGVLRHIPFLYICFAAFVTGVFAPALYLYALYRLIRIIDETGKKA